VNPSGHDENFRAIIRRGRRLFNNARANLDATDGFARSPTTR
jgi:hypothetical protein